MYTRIVLFILIGFSVRPIMAQQSLSVSTNTISASNTGVDKFYYGHQNEPPRAIEFKEKTVTAAYFLTNINHYFVIPSEFTFIEAESNTDNLGMLHRLLQQYYKGIPLEGMGYRIHEKDGFLRSVNGKAVRNINMDAHINVNINEEQAFQLAVKYLNTKDTVFRQGKKLIVSKDFTFTPESFSIAFQFDIDVSLIERWRISIDASSGQVINKVSLVNSCFKDIVPPLPYGKGTGLTRYYGSKTIRVETLGNGSRLVGQTDNGVTIGTYDFGNLPTIIFMLGDYRMRDISSVNNNYNSQYYKPAVSAQWATEQAYNYYFKKHNRNSFDNKGGTIKSLVHVGQGLDNAFWTGTFLAFGDGTNNNPLVELDVVSHELTHGVTQYEAHLQYNNESGALNESFSDIMGKAVEFDTFGDTATWQLAKHYLPGGLRDFSNPNLKNQPDTYQGNMWYTGFDDSGGVHTNSGVQNFWFYLLCKGGSGVNDHKLNYTVKSIGMDTATNIVYRNLTEYLSYSSDYLDSRFGSLLATADLYGKNSTAYQQVANAWDAVGVVDEPIITRIGVYDITATTVKINGSLLPRGDTVTYHFEYGTTPALGSSSSIYKYTNTVAGIVTGLQSKTKYYCRLVATNEHGSSYATTEFTTISLAPLVKIKQTVDVAETNATLYGQVNPNSLPTSFYFEYGLTQALGLITPSYPISDTTEFLNVSASILNLQPRQTYYYKLVATNGFASSSTETVSFFTAVKPVINSYTPVTAPIGAEVTITGQNFNSKPDNNLVSFGATRATVLSSSSTEIKVKVPAGASLGTITLLDAESGLAAESIQEFVPTFTGGLKKGDLKLTMGSNDVYIYNTLVQDMDGDNKPDIVARHYQGFSVYQNVNQGGVITNESFIRSGYTLELTNDDYLSVADFDGNGLKDVLVRSPSGLKIYPNFSVPGYIFFGVPIDLPTGYLRGLTFNDYDQDGRIDIAGIRYLRGDSSMCIIVRNQNPKGYLSANNFEQRYSKVLPYYIYRLYSDDLNNDGKPELLAGTYKGSFVAILKNTSYPGTFAFEENNIQNSTMVTNPQYVSQDLNQDGWKDITSYYAASSSASSGSVVILENKGTSPVISMKDPVVALTGYPDAVVQAGDINGDGNVDLLVGINGGKFIFAKNKTVAGQALSSSSFEQFETYISPSSSSATQSGMTISDLNGDGRPDVINTYYYNTYVHDGYQMEIWQNSPPDCLDPSGVKVTVTGNTATIVLPPNTTLDQFELEYTATSGYTYWRQISSTSLSDLTTGYTYQLRARSKCYMGFTDYYYMNFTTECVNTNNFSITSISVNSVNLYQYNLNSIEVQYSQAGKDQWQTLPQNVTQITNLLPGTTYDVRIRGRCNTPTQFKYSQFTTLCPNLSTLTITDLTSNKAVVNWTSNYTGNATLEYSTDNVTWKLIDETMFPLMPVKKYFVRGRMACSNINSDFIYTSFTTPCPKVSMLQPDNVTPFTASVNWIDESSTHDYIVTYSTPVGGRETTVEINSTSFSLDGLIPGTQYTVSVAPQCTATKDFTSTTFSTVCYAPINLLVNAITHNTAELSWNDNFGGLPYSIDYSVLGSKVWLTTKTGLTNISLTNLRPGTKYEARVHINCSSEKAPYVSLVFETTLYEETTFAPNPTDSKVTIYPSEDLIGNHFIILDNTGRIVADAELLNYTIDLSTLSAGIYILKIDGEKTMKIIKH